MTLMKNFYQNGISCGNIWNEGNFAQVDNAESNCKIIREDDLMFLNELYHHDEASDQTLLTTTKLESNYDFLKKNVLLLRPDDNVRALQTAIRDETTSRNDFVFHADRLIRLVIEESLNQLPHENFTVSTPAGCEYEGLKFLHGNCGVSIIRSGEAMERGLRDCCRSMRIGKILIQSSKDNDDGDDDACNDKAVAPADDDASQLNAASEPKLIYTRLPARIGERKVLLMYPILATGRAVLKALNVLRSYGVSIDNVILVTLFASPQGGDFQDTKSVHINNQCCNINIVSVEWHCSISYFCHDTKRLDFSFLSPLHFFPSSKQFKHIKAELDLADSTLEVRTTPKTFDPYIILKARDVMRLLARSVPFEHAIDVLQNDKFSDIIEIKLPNRERFLKRRNRLIGENGETLKALELSSNCYIVVQGKTVSVIGSYGDLLQVRKIVTGCIYDNIHPAYSIKRLLIIKKLKADPSRANLNWDRFLPKLRKKVLSRRRKPHKIRTKKDYTPFPPAPEPSKIDLELEKGTYFLATAERKRVEAADKIAKSAETARHRKIVKRRAAFLPPPNASTNGEEEA